MKTPQEAATEGRYDYQAVLVKSDGSFGNCTGTLIAPGYVLTLGYCTTFEGYTKVQIGRHDLSDDNEDYEEINIATIIVDDKNSELGEADDYRYFDTVAIMKLEEESSIEPVTLDAGSTDLSVDTEVTVLGWGLPFVGVFADDNLAFDDEDVGGLLETETKVALSEICEEFFFSTVNVDFDKILCTNRTDAEDYGDVCYGDVGSAVIVKGSSSSSDVQVGVDFMSGCSTFGGVIPGFLFRVSYYKDFIDCVLNGGTDSCGKTTVLIEAPTEAPTEACKDSKTLLKLVRGSFGFE